MLTWKCLLIAALCVAPALGWARCQILTPIGSVVTVDGSIGSEWNDASTMSAFQNGCLAGGVPVEVRAKRDANNLYFAFTVADSTQVGPGELGERLIIQLSPTNLNGTTLGNGESYKINVGHRRDQTTLDSDRTYYRSSGTITCSGNAVPTWQTQSWPAGLEVRIGTVSAAGYALEFKVPKGALGITGAIPDNLAMSFILVDNRPPPDGNAYASWFPSDLPVDQVATTGQIIDASDPTGACNDWVKRNEWGLASRIPSGDVRIARTPQSWLSEDIDTFQCPVYSGSGDQYNYYPNSPCRIKVQYWLRNTNPFVEKRDVLVLAGVHGAGQLQWQKVQFREQLSIDAPAAGQTERRMSFLSETQGGSDLAFLPPPNINGSGHPCVRVYILPAFDAAAFPKSTLRNNTNFTDAQLLTMQGAYSLDLGNHMAQQNITRAAQPNCPSTGCRTASLEGLKLGRLSDSTFDWSMPAIRGLLNSAHAQPTSAREAARIGLPGSFLERFGRDNVIVAIRAEGHNAALPPGGPTYRITQEVGGVVQLFPLAQLEGKKGLPVQLFIGNTKQVAQTISLVAEVRYPTGAPQVPLNLPSQPRTVEPSGSFVVRGTLGAQQTPSCSCGDFKCMLDQSRTSDSGAIQIAGLLMVGGLGVGGMAFVRRRKRKE